jgi:hypothetical protein
MSKPPHGRAIEKMATEIGYICIHWGWLEEVLDLLIALLAPIDEQRAWHAITGNLDIRQKTQVLRALFFIKKDTWSAEWYELAVETINTIDNDLRPRRNHIVHSSLQNQGKRLLHEKKMVKVSKPQAFQPSELTTIDVRPARIASVRKLKADIYTHVTRCLRIYSFAMYPDFFVSRGLSFRRFLHQGEFAARRKRKRSKPQRPLPSPRAKSQ